jgi:hypothetical protein
MADFFIHVDMGNRPSLFTTAFYRELAGEGFVSTGEDFLARVGFDQNAVAWHKTFRDAGHAGGCGKALRRARCTRSAPTIRVSRRPRSSTRHRRLPIAGWAWPGSARFIPGAPFTVPVLRPRANWMDHCASFDPRSSKAR